LAELGKSSKESSPEVLGGTVGEQFAVLESASSVLDVNGFLDAVQLCHDVGVIQLMT
jgi:hypothetical protein